MNQALLSFICVFLFIACNVSVTPDYRTEVRRHRSVAIMPFVVNIYKITDSKLTSSQQLEAKELALSKLFQQQAYDFFTNRKTRNSQVHVAVQHVSETNKKLAELGITYKQISLFSEKELAHFLGVDSFIYGNIDLRNNPSASQAVHLVSISSFSANQEMLAEIDVKLASAISESIIWQYKEFSKGYSFQETRNDTLLFNCLLTYPLSRIQYKGIK
mgnify:CR=1 FL=1